MNDSLLSRAKKTQIIKAIRKEDYAKIIAILDAHSTSHAGTAKMKDKRYVIGEIIRHIADNYKGREEKAYFSVGKKILSVKSDNAKEIGIHIIWRAYRYNKKVVEGYLRKITNDANWEVREYAAGALQGTLNAFPEIYNTLKKWSKDKSENIRRGVVMAAIGLRNKYENITLAFQLLEPLMYDSSAYVKKNLGPFVLGSYYGNSYPKETFKQLNKWIKIKNENLRWNIAMAFNNSFGNKYPEEAIEYMRILSRDTSPMVQRAVKSTLNHLKKRHNNLKI
jgi:3-methyladenine DNA glycosylase AlkC